MALPVKSKSLSLRIGARLPPLPAVSNVQILFPRGLLVVGANEQVGVSRDERWSGGMELKDLMQCPSGSHD